MKQAWVTRLSFAIATLARLGLVAPAPGTCATLITVAFICLLAWAGLSLAGYTAVVICSLCIAYVSILRALPLFHNDADPSSIVIDEFVGTLVSFAGFAVNIQTIVLGFVLFRFFDIIKPLGIKRVERLSGAWGILADDLVAGVYANIGLHLFSWLLA